MGIDANGRKPTNGSAEVGASAVHMLVTDAVKEARAGTVTAAEYEIEVIEEEDERGQWVFSAAAALPIGGARCAARSTGTIAGLAARGMMGAAALSLRAARGAVHTASGMRGKFTLERPAELIAEAEIEGKQAVASAKEAWTAVRDMSPLV